VNAAVFVRGVNTGDRTLRTGEFARGFTAFEIVNIGAAGTFVAFGTPSLSALRAAIQNRLPFPAEVLIASDREVKELIRTQPFGRDPPLSGVRRAVTVINSKPAKSPSLPLQRPGGAAWELRILALHGHFVLSETRRLNPKRVVYPNEVVEKEYGVPATTRWWETLGQVHALLTGKRDE
jgi:uncharacterized protein (DUF1697 family)